VPGLASPIKTDVGGEAVRRFDLIYCRVALFYCRVALGAAFLSAVGSRFGLWTGRPASEAFTGFLAYTAEVNSFMPDSTIPFLAWAATVLETLLGLALVSGIGVHRAALGSALLLALFGIAMAVSFGLGSPLDYSVFSASAAALLLSRPVAVSDSHTKNNALED
jgi:uncharacterized membrane protein YphA (DoxX/SURF4 family)